MAIQYVATCTRTKLTFCSYTSGFIQIKMVISLMPFILFMYRGFGYIFEYSIFYLLYLLDDP